MRNGNLFLQLWLIWWMWVRFLPYLWGMETISLCTTVTLRYSFLPYLWGMETKKGKKYLTKSIDVLTVPMRNGNKITLLSHCRCLRVLTVPMRNGNRNLSRLSSPGMVIVLTVPMRNGNWILPVTDTSDESCSYRTYEEWKPDISKGDINSITVLTVPMRNGNMHILLFLHTPVRVLTVPMRNGNEGLSAVWDCQSVFCSYRTYEEWKLRDLCIFLCLHQAFLPYLWGMETRYGELVCHRDICRSYRTYEEWKQRGCNRTVTAAVWVLTVPMRNGNHL